MKKGQESCVSIIKPVSHLQLLFLMQHSVEDRILQLQTKKSALVKGALGGQGAEEAKAMRVADLKWLFDR